nr:MAG TPA: hypothetical protein [Caudoviricetes sp.]
MFLLNPAGFKPCGILSRIIVYLLIRNFQL